MESSISIILFKIVLSMIIIIPTIIMYAWFIYPNSITLMNIGDFADKWNFGCAATVFGVLSLIGLYLIVTGDFIKYS